MKRLYSVALLAAGFALGACQFFGPNTAEQTLVAENYMLNTQIASVRGTATVEADRILITLEHAQTAASHVDGQTQELQATLIARGTIDVNAAALSPQAPLIITTPPPILELGNGQNVAPISITPGGADTSAGNLAAPVGTPDPAQAPPVAGPSLTNIVTAEGVRDDDCAQAAVTQFTTDMQDIYVVATANNVGPQDTVTSRWIYQDQEIVNYDWSPDFQIDSACIWFFIEQGEVNFTPGNWRVQLELNGSPYGTPASFVIADVSAQGDAALEQAVSGAQPTAAS